MAEPLGQVFAGDHGFDGHDEWPAWEKSIGLEDRLDFLLKFLGSTAFVC
jgi:hypothetical protein